MIRTILLILFPGWLFAQPAGFLHLTTQEDTATSFFNHIKCQIDINYNDDTANLYSSKRIYMQFRIGIGPWINTNQFPTFSESLMGVYKGKMEIYASPFQLFEDGVYSIDSFATNYPLVELRYYMLAAFVENSNAPYQMQEYYSNSVMVYLPPATNDDRLAFQYLINNLKLNPYFTWLSNLIYDKQYAVLQHIAYSYPNSTLADIAEYYTITKYLSEHVIIPHSLEKNYLLPEDKAIVIPKATTLLNKAKSKFIKDKTGKFIKSYEYNFFNTCFIPVVFGGNGSTTPVSSTHPSTRHLNLHFWAGRVSDMGRSNPC